LNHKPEKLTALRTMHRYSQHETTRGRDEIITETEFAVHLDGQEYCRLLCLPAQLECLAVGHLALAGRLAYPEEIAEITVNGPERTIRVRTRSGGKPPPAAKQAGELRISPEEVRQLAGQLPLISALFKRTGAVHIGGLAEKGSLLFTMEDTGRHNVLDKIYGRSFLENIPLKDKALLFSGRSTAEVIMTLARMSIPMIVARGAPTTLAINLAEKAGITLIAFARPDRISVFSHTERITASL
jgi:FdhD protein